MTLADLSLEERVYLYVVANPGLTLDDVARGVKGRTAEVRDVLLGERFSSSLREAYPSDRALVYQVAPKPRDGSGRAKKRTQEQKIEAVLADGKWHTAEELHKRCGFMRLNSRVAGLRKKRGLLIECERIAGVENGAGAYRYRLIPTVTVETSKEAAPDARSLPTDAGSAASSDASCPRDSEGSNGASDDEQLSLPEAA